MEGRVGAWKGASAGVGVVMGGCICRGGHGDAMRRVGVAMGGMI